MQGSLNHFLEGKGELRALIRSHDWCGSSLGQPDTWPQSFKTLVRFALESKFPMFLTWGDELTVLYNDAYSEILGKRHPSALGKPLREIWFDVWDDVSPYIQRALNGESVYLENLPLTMYRKGYEESTWFTFTYYPLRDDDGVVRGMSCVCMETTVQVLAEQQKVAEIQRLQDLFQQAPGFMALTAGPEHVYELANPANFRILGRNVIGKRIRDALPDLEGQGYFEILDKVYESGEPFTGKAMPIRLQQQPNARLDERLIDFIFQPVKDGHGKVTGVFIQGHDVTEAVKTTQALHESEERLLQLVNNIPHPAWMANPNGDVHWYNERWYEYTGLPLEGEEWSWEEVVEPAYLPDMLQKWDISIATGVNYEVTAPVRSAEGEYRVFYIRAAPLRDVSGNIIQWFGINTDVTEIHKAQQELVIASRRKDDFLAMLAHELRNPLAPITSAAELLKFPHLDEKKIRQTSEVIARQVSHMRDLINDLLDVSRVTRGLVTFQEEMLDITAVVAEAAEQAQPLFKAKKQHLTTLNFDEALYVKGDRTRLTQVITNLLNNAAKYTPEGGSITVRLTACQDQVTIAVQDTGIGISPDLLPHVFELFTQGERSVDRAQGGLGLGLALVKSLVELHKGTVSAKSLGLGKGSEFSLNLPRLLDIPAARTNTDNSNLNDSHAPCRILIVDDNIDAAEMLAMLLKTQGHTVSVEYDARQALERAQCETPDIAFLDIGLPEMNGYELANRLRAMPEMAKTKLIAVTGYGQQADKKLAFTSGFDHHLVKPVSLDSILCDVIQKQSNK